MRDNGEDDPQPKRLVYEMRERVQHVRNQFWEEGIEGQRRPATKKRLAAAAIEYWDVLWEHRDESVLDEGDFPDIRPIKSRVGKTTEIPTAAGGRGRGSGTDTVPAIVEVSADDLLALTEDLDDLAKKLGFSASVTTETPMFGVDPEWEDGEA